MTARLSYMVQLENNGHYPHDLIDAEWMATLPSNVLPHINNVSFCEGLVKIWMIINCESESELIYIIESLPLIEYYEYQYTELATSISLMHFNDSLSTLDS